jgi:4-aminobutyrate aminotransferase-like enzyme
MRRLIKPIFRSLPQRRYYVKRGEPIPSTDELDTHAFILSQYKESLAPALTHLTNFVTDRAQGSWVYDDQNNDKYLDFTCGIGV